MISLICGISRINDIERESRRTLVTKGGEVGEMEGCWSKGTEMQ